MEKSFSYILHIAHTLLSLLVVFLGKALNWIPPSVCGGKVFSYSHKKMVKLQSHIDSAEE